MPFGARFGSSGRCTTGIVAAKKEKGKKIKLKLGRAYLHPLLCTTSALLQVCDAVVGIGINVLAVAAAVAATRRRRCRRCCRGLVLAAVFSGTTVVAAVVSLFGFGVFACPVVGDRKEKKKLKKGFRRTRIFKKTWEGGLPTAIHSIGARIRSSGPCTASAILQKKKKK
jgi:hypothetical protein